ncbi:MAG: single-stranded DNA-binding protein [Clostridia bacterium]|nr:single-stranded DNA-binding protein [Clostridia bacterium]
MLNSVILMGRLTADPELRHTPNDVSVTTFSIAVDRDFARSGTERQTDFFNIVAWRQTAEFVCRYFRKGQLVALKGSAQSRSYTDKDGNKRTAFEIVADNVYFAEPKRSGDSQPAAETRYEEPSSFSNGSADDFEEIADDDLPF